jgi:hypothetical protein
LATFSEFNAMQKIVLAIFSHLVTLRMTQNMCSTDIMHSMYIQQDFSPRINFAEFFEHC